MEEHFEENNMGGNRKGQVEKWQKRIEDTFCGPNDIVGERVLELQEKERQNERELVKFFAGYVRLMDAFFDFVIETIRSISERTKIEGADTVAVITAMQVILFWRIRSSYNIFWKGYCVDALSLLRSVFEQVLEIAALKSGIVNIDEVFGNLKDRDIRKYSQDENIEELINNFKKNDRKITAYIIGPSSGLSLEAKEDLKILIRILHQAVHKSRVNVATHLIPWARGAKKMPIFPECDADIASLYTNISCFLAWMIVRTLPLLQIRSSEFTEDWRKKFKILDESFQLAITGMKKRMGRSIEELISKKFDFGC